MQKTQVLLCKRIHMKDAWYDLRHIEMYLTNITTNTMTFLHPIHIYHLSKSIILVETSRCNQGQFSMPKVNKNQQSHILALVLEAQITIVRRYCKYDFCQRRQYVITSTTVITATNGLNEKVGEGTSIDRTDAKRTDADDVI